MAETFDPYRKWLGIPPEEQPPNHYRLLGVGLFEADADVIEGAADRQMAHIQRHQLGQFAVLSQRILNELSAAKICLLKADRKEAYDRALRKQLAATAAPPPPAAAPIGPVPIPRGQLPAAPEPPAVENDDENDAANVQAATAMSDLSQERRPVGKRRTTSTHNSASRKTAGKKSGSKKSGSNLIIGGVMAAGVAVVAIIGIVASRDKPPQTVVQAPAEPSNKPLLPFIEKPTTGPDVEPVAEATAPAEVESAPKPPKVTPKPATEAPQTDDADTSELASGNITDLLTLAKVSPKTAVGNWRKSKKGLTLLASKSAMPRIVLPYAPPNEYQLEMLIEPQPSAEVVLGLLMGGNQFTAVLDGWGGETSGLQLIDSSPGDENNSTHHGQALHAGQPNRVLVTVRGNRVVVSCDGTTLIDWRGPAERLSLAPAQNVPDKRALFIAGGNGTAFRIASLRLATLSGKGQELGDPVAAPADVARVEPEPEMPLEQPAVTPPASEPSLATKHGGFELTGHTQPIRAITIHPDSKQVISAAWFAPGDDHPVRIWNLAQQGPSPVPPGDRLTNAVDFAPEGDEYFAALETGIDYRRVFPPGQVRTVSTFNWPLYCISAAAGHDLIACGGGGGVAVTSMAQEAVVFLWSSPTAAPVHAIALSDDGRRMWAGCGGKWNGPEAIDGNDFKLRLWDGPTRDYAELDGHKGCIWGIAATSDGSRVATASHDRTVRIWDAKTHKAVRTLTGHDGPVFAVAISADGKQVLSGGADKTVRLWDVRSGRELNRFAGHTDIVRAVALTPDGKYALSGGNDKVLRVWELGGLPRRPGAVVAKPEPAKNRTPAPAKADLEEATKLIREVFADDFKQAKKPADKLALAEKLLKQSSESQTDTERYALLVEARSLAATGGSPALAIQIIDETGNRFEIDTAHEIADLIEQLSKDTLPPAVRKELAESLLPIADQAVARSDYDTARRLLAAAVQSARKTNDNALVKQVATRVQEVGDAKKLFDAYRKALDKITESADDPAANLAAGKYLCFVNQDWVQGLAHLAKGSDETLRQIAELELKPPANPEEQVKLGDLWWGLVEQAKGQEKVDYADRCDKWYSSALPGLKGLTQTKVSKRIEELAATHKPAGPAATTPAATPSERPATGEAGGTAASAKIVAKIKMAIRKEMLVRSNTIAGRNGTAFAEIPPSGAILAGFNYTTVPEQNGGELSSIQAIYWTPKGTVNGDRWGVENGQVTTVVAKKGYAVAGLRTGGSVYEIAWFEIVFAKLGATGLDMTDKYSSQWTGNKYWSAITLGDNGQLVTGIFGAVNGSQLSGLGLVQMPEK